MKNRVLTFAVGLLAFFIFQQNTAAQKICDGKQLFSEKSCAGDTIDAKEKELFRLINEYRTQNKLPALVLNDDLSVVANRRLLDLNINVKTLTHSWSNCPYDINNESTWGCVLKAPKMLGVKYEGNGYENLYRNYAAVATPAHALEAWKKSPLHNALLLNLDVFKNLKWDGIGIAISSNYAVIWVGARETAPINNNLAKGLGITFEGAVSGLTKVVKIQKISGTESGNQWVGTSADKTVTLEIFGRQQDISEATFALKIKLEKSALLSDNNRQLLLLFVNNLIPNWSQRESWCSEAVSNLAKNRKILQQSPVGERYVEMSLSADNMLSVRIKPNNKSTVLQF